MHFVSDGSYKSQPNVPETHCDALFLIIRKFIKL